MKNFIVITTINPKSLNISKFEELVDWNIVVVGDRKSQQIESTGNLKFISIEEQHSLPFELARRCPENHYARKNIGYLYAISQGASVIYETDDDNFPCENWMIPKFSASKFLNSSCKFLNVYRHFTDEHVWPRGYPLDEISGDQILTEEDYEQQREIGVWQGLADGDPDVDAIFRLVFNKEIIFNKRPPVAIPENHYSAFNSQNTFWQEKAFEYLYLPATTSFRYTDILRSYIAQPLMWRKGLLLGFTEATVFQSRNVHDLMQDFEQEIECYIGIKSTVELIEKLLNTTTAENDHLNVYKMLVENKILDKQELVLCDLWHEDLRAAWSMPAG